MVSMSGGGLYTDRKAVRFPEYAAVITILTNHQVTTITTPVEGTLISAK